MPIPLNHQMVGPAIGGPFRTIECPDDGADVQAEDIRRLAAALLRNDVFVQAETFTNYSASANATGPSFAFGGIYLFTTAVPGWVDSPLLVDIPAVSTGDDLIVKALGNWQFNASSTANVATKVRLAVIEDFGGASTLIALPGSQIIIDNTPGPALPRNQNYTLSAIHRVITPGPARLIVQGIVYDLTGGAGTGTATMMFDNQIVVTHHNRQVL